MVRFARSAELAGQRSSPDRGSRFSGSHFGFAIVRAKRVMVNGQIQRAALAVRLFDGFRLATIGGTPADDAVIVIRGRRTRSLLAYLLLAPDQTASRERLAGLLWSDRSDAQARSSLRQCLLELRTAGQGLGIEAFEAGRDMVRLVPGVFACDVFDIEQALVNDDASALAARIVQIGNAQLLPDLGVPGLFGEWLDQTRAALDGRLAQAVRTRLERLVAAQDWPDAVALADAWLRREPLDENVVAAALHAELALGAEAAAQRRFRAFKAVLEKELGVAPGAAVQAAMARVEPRAAVAPEANVRPALAAPPAPGPSPGPGPAPRLRMGERRHVAVLNCALKIDGGDPDADNDVDAEDDLDPEDWSGALDRFATTARGALESFDCHVTVNGATLSVLFGFDRVMEDDVLRAVRGAGAVIAAVGVLPLSAGLSARCAAGIDSGPLVASASATSEPERPPAGPALDRAARLQLQAAPGSVLVSNAVARIARGYCALERVDGGAFRVVAGEAPQSRFEVSRARGLSRFVGRAEDFDRLCATLADCGAGTGQVLGIMADAGTGKTRLCFEFVEHCRAQGIAVHTGAATVETRNTPFKAVLDVLRSLLGCDPRDAPADARARIEARALALDPQLAGALPLLFDLLGLSDPQRPAPALDSSARQRQFAGMLGHLLARAGSNGPSVVLIEDLHWIDDASLAVIEHLVEAHAAAGAVAHGALRNLLLLNYRPEFRAPFMQNSVCRQMSLSPLSDNAVATLLEDLLGSDPGLATLAAPITERTGGNPYFVEEMVQTLAETGVIAGERGACRLTGAYDPLRIPPTVRAVVSARIDRLPLAARRVLQVAAVIGPRFAEPLLESVVGQSGADLPTADLGEALTTLRRHEFIVDQAAFPLAEYAFKHPLTLEMARESLTRASRSEINASVAVAVEAQEADRLDAVAATLARHWEHAGRDMVAARWHRRAAEGAGRSDFPTSARHWGKALALSRGKLAEPDDFALAFAACINLLNFNYRTGIDIDAARAVLAEGDALAAAIGNEPMRLTLALCFSRAFCAAGDAEAYYVIALDNHARAQAEGMAELQSLATLLLTDALVYTGRSERLLDETDRAIGRWPHDMPHEMWISGTNPHTFFAFMRGAALNWLGRLDEARAQYAHAITLAELDETPEVVGWTAFLLCQSIWRIGDAEQTMACARRVAQVAETLGSPLLILYRHIGHVLAWLCAGEPARAIAEAEQAMEVVKRTEFHWSGATRLYFAQALLEGGRPQDALAQARLAVSECRTCGTAHFEAEAWGVLAMALLAVDGVAARAEIEQALDEVARKLADGVARVLEPELREWRGALALALGDRAGAAGHFEAARAIHRARGAEPRIARLCDRKKAL